MSCLRIVDPNRSGKILSLHIENFMHFQCFHIEFNNRINFILGRNGSGKSAIMAAITLVLGGRSRSTNRFNHVEEFIKRGETSAYIEINVGNSGAHAYNSNIYGDMIYISRTIRHTGTSSYNLKNMCKRTVSKKFSDLHNMMMFFGIHVDNPLIMMNQNKLVEALCGRLDPKQMFDLFWKSSFVVRPTECEQTCQLAHVKQSFTALCKIVGMNAQLAINVKEKTLEIRATRSGTYHEQHDNLMSTTGFISSSERSLTIISLLAALWATSNNHIFFLDGYAHFGDIITLEYLTSLLIREGHRYPNCQYFFFTAHDMSIPRASDAIKIQRLPYP